MPALDMEIAIETAAEDDLAVMEDIDRSEINALAAQEEPLDPADEEEEF
jgi:hypothetical protein